MEPPSSRALTGSQSRRPIRQGDMATLPLQRTDRLERATEIAGRLVANGERVVPGKRREIKLVLATLLCEGHVLFEDVPGTAKTVLARSIAQSIEGAKTSRIQCTTHSKPT